MKYIKLFFESFSDNIDDCDSYKGIWKIVDLKISKIWKEREHWSGKDVWRDVSINKRLRYQIINTLTDSNLKFEIVEKDKSIKHIAIHFTTPKRFDRFTANTHEYSPADLYYTIRIYEYEDDWILFQWFGQSYATQEHMENYYKKYPHFGPGGRNHTFIDGNGQERLSYQPPLYNGYQPYIGDSFCDRPSYFYLCDQMESILLLLNEFISFMKDPKKSLFETDYEVY